MDVSTNAVRKIKIAMFLKGIRQADIAAQNNVSKQAINNTIHGARSERLRRAISNILGIPMSIWDEMDRGQKIQEVRKS